MGRGRRAKGLRTRGAAVRTLRPVGAQARAKSGCPDFDLAPVVEFSPQVFSEAHDDTDAFILAMALAFNDMKGVHWVIRQLNKCKPEDEARDSQVGQWNGMQLQMSRLGLLILHELLKAISRAEQIEVFRNEHYSKAVKRLSRRSRKDWNELISLARKTRSRDPVRQYIMEVRNNFAAHYYKPTELLKGYRNFFFKRSVDGFNTHALASLGDEVEATRFYFADAAVQMGQKLLDPKDALVQGVYEYTLRLFQALRFLIEEYLNLKSEALVVRREEGQ